MEKELIEWARDKIYLVQDRIWPGQRRQEHLHHLQLNPIERTKSRLFQEAAEQGEIETAYFTRDVYIPNGVLNYRLGRLDFSNTINSEEELQSLLCSQLPYFHQLRAWLDFHQKNWRSEQYSLAQRKSNTLVYVDLTKFSQGARRLPDRIAIAPWRMQEEYKDHPLFKIWKLTALLGKKRSERYVSKL